LMLSKCSARQFACANMASQITGVTIFEEFCLGADTQVNRIFRIMFPHQQFSCIE